MTDDNGNGRVTMARLEERIKAVETRLERTATTADIDHLRADITQFYSQLCKQYDDHEGRIRTNERHVVASEQRWERHKEDHVEIKGKMRIENIIGSVAAAIGAMLVALGMRA